MTKGSPLGKGNQEYETGFYWVVYLPEVADSWTVADYNGIGWFIVGIEESVPIEDLMVGEYIAHPRRYFGIKI